MQINRARIRNLGNYLSALQDGVAFRAVFALGDGAALHRLGLSDDPGQGETILPRAIGPISRFNAEGRWVPLKDQPKESRYIRTLSWNWTTWDGQEHSDSKDIYRDCYQRAFDPPPGIELTYVEQAGRRLIISPQLQNVDAQATRNLHVINLLLEVFGACELVTADLAQLTPAVLNRANWRILPPGQHPWERIAEYLDRAIGRLGEGTQRVIRDRQRTIQDHGPDEVWVGEGGFDDYMAYVFRDRGIVVLESVRKGNAIYAFTSNWRAVSQLTKAEIIQNDLHQARIVHIDGWKGRLSGLLRKAA
jgi:hypothetical protein